ncbi:tyrosine-type recombinase/integrase [Hymenobacter sp. BT664]|uniref:Tyrosine-type recombinase/integrase n=1 Tax=Hymenobacter montanus TaxID=2771359 RepID=A0A927BEB8_9BACT|nr:site-specific integrase [Hymenobacter montanus]MBD2768482.1 tyrosine-type recombinase/integrase [Hymenobacter montanus]
MVTQFVLRKQKKNAAGECPVQMIVYFDGARLACSIGEKCKVTDWNADRQQFRRSYPLAEDANRLLARLTADVLSWWRTLRATGEAPTLAGLRAALRPAPAAKVAVVEQYSLTQLNEEHGLALRARGYADHTLRQRKMMGSWLVAYEQASGELLDPTTYDLATHDRLLTYLRFDRNLAQNTVASVVRGLKVLLRWCREERGLAVGVELRKLQGRHADVVKMWLSADDLKALATVMLPEYLGRVRDVLLFCCYTGLRYSDVWALQPGNLHEWNGARVLRLVQTKTRTGVSIYLTEAAGAILDKYADRERLRLLPVLANQVMNRYLKRVGKYAGLTAPVVVAEQVDGVIIKSSVPKYELLTTHTARHTFATQSLLRGMPVEVLQKVMGHAKIQTTLIYAKVIEDLQHQTMRRVWEGQGAMDSTGAQSSQICAVEPSAA